MAANDFIYASTPLASDMAVKNTDSVDFAAGDVIKADATNVVSATQRHIGALRATTDDYPLGVAMEAIPQGKTGRVRPIGIAQVVATAAITAGVAVQADTTGRVKAQAAAKPQLGQALTAAGGAGDKLLVAISIAKNA